MTTIPLSLPTPNPTLLSQRPQVLSFKPPPTIVFSPQNQTTIIRQSFTHSPSLATHASTSGRERQKGKQKRGPGDAPRIPSLRPPPPRRLVGIPRNAGQRSANSRTRFVLFRPSLPLSLSFSSSLPLSHFSSSFFSPTPSPVIRPSLYLFTRFPFKTKTTKQTLKRRK